MHQTLEFVLRHGYLLIFFNVFLEQLGLPIPTQPILLAFGALAGAGKMSYPMGLALAVLATLAADTLWYFLGRRRGAAVLRLLCRISLEPDSCVRQTESVFLRYGPRALLFAKFVPGGGGGGGGFERCVSADVRQFPHAALEILAVRWHGSHCMGRLLHADRLDVP